MEVHMLSRRVKPRIGELPGLGVIVCVCTLLWTVGAKAQDIQASAGVVCDTQEQMEKFIAYAADDPRSALVRVNTEAANPQACGHVTAAFVRGAEVSTARIKHRGFAIHQITIFAVNTEAGWRRLGQPLAQFAAFPTNELSA
jgi:hypothetical protein